MFLQKFKDLYNIEKYTFSINDNILYYIITEWKKATFRFKKEFALYNTKDYKNRILLREFRTQNLYIESKKKYVILNFIICGNDENIERMRISHKYYINST